jgi:hypothetical protein
LCGKRAVTSDGFDNGNNGTGHSAYVTNRCGITTSLLKVPSRAKKGNIVRWIIAAIPLTAAAVVFGIPAHHAPLALDARCVAAANGWQTCAADDQGSNLRRDMTVLQNQIRQAQEGN